MSSENNSKRTRYCVAPGCKNYECGIKTMNDETNQQTITYHNFPTNSSLRNKWFKFVGYDKKPVSSLTWRTWTLCSDHFEDSEFEESCHLECIDGVYRRLNIKLKNGAVPTKSKLLSISIQPTDGENQTELNNPIDFIKNEYIDIDFDNELINTRNDEDFHSKCGEVFVTRKGTFLYFCTFCNENLEDADKFSKHVYKKHLSLYDYTEINNINTINIKTEDIISPNNTIIPLQHCEIVKNEADELQHCETEAGNSETISSMYVDDIQNNENEINQNIYAEKITREESKKSKVELQNKSLVNPPIQNIESIAMKSTQDNHKQTHTKQRPETENSVKKNERKRNNSVNGSVQTRSCIKKNQCEYCQKILSSRSVLNEHLRIHTGEKPYSCTYCEKKFRAKSILFYHVKSHSGTKPYECKYCQKKFGLVGSMVAHERIHTGEKPYRCSYCDKSFSKKQSQMKHETTHLLGYKRRNDEKENNSIWKCDMCGKIVLTKYTLCNHIRTHTGERPFKCSYCPSAFKSLSQHSQHERIHSGLKPYKCTECGKAFTTKSQINAHMRSHATKIIKIYKCDQCEKEFKFNAYLVAHQRKHHKSEI